jgi:hypothetical protein
MRASIDHDAGAHFLLKRLERLIDGSAQGGLFPSFRRQHIVGAIQRMQAGDKGITLASAFHGLIRNSLDRRERVFDSVSHFAYDQLLLLLETFSLGNIPGDFGRSHDSAIRIFHR